MVEKSSRGQEKIRVQGFEGSRVHVFMCFKTPHGSRG